ncbi:hypothetical protein DRO58_02745 [Candidatus Bathyarchaeota archaeon]|nr:MAG: hypothetical protein DRO58_02745 [Candidatus Bathyarchaeota archaeon]
MFSPTSFATGLRRLKVSYEALGQSLCRLGLPGKYLRKWHYNFMLSYTSESVIDFMQGRSLGNVGGLHYLDKRRKAIEAYSRALPRLLQLIPP